MMLFLIGKINKTNENRVMGVNINWKRYPLRYMSVDIIVVNRLAASVIKLVSQI